VKGLSWDNGGFVLYYKRLESGRFRLPPVPKDALGAQLDATQLAMLLDGIDVARVRRPARWTPPEDARGNLQKLPDLISPARWTSPRLTRASGATRRNASAGKSPGCKRGSPPSRETSSRCSGPSSASEARRCRPSANSCAGTSRRPRRRR
ncbi:MAG: IS66 family insertion sequence element accessory protein TnpB, partial [Deltaproteobacteria bacterium]|nr:IS66 family insertion sequence element accessory protein TnpB [Deltaproteobacteria bacterium]